MHVNDTIVNTNFGKKHFSYITTIDDLGALKV